MDKRRSACYQNARTVFNTERIEYEERDYIDDCCFIIDRGDDIWRARGFR